MKLTNLPPVPAVLKDEYRKLISQVEHECSRLHDHLREHLRCAPGCSSCCRSFAVAPVEAAVIAGRLAQTGIQLATGRTGDHCTLLAEGLCSIYDSRPLICRTQGLPIGYIDEINERIDVSVCPLNFSDDYPFTEDDLLLLDPFNRHLADINSRYCMEAGISRETRISLG